MIVIVPQEQLAQFLERVQGIQDSKFVVTMKDATFVHEAHFDTHPDVAQLPFCDVITPPCIDTHPDVAQLPFCDVITPPCIDTHPDVVGSLPKLTLIQTLIPPLL